MYAGNIYFWQKYRVNYSFIFGFKEGTQLGYRDVFFLSFGLSVLAQASVLSNLDLEMDPKTKSYHAITELFPLALLVVRSSDEPYFMAPSNFQNMPLNTRFSFFSAACDRPFGLPIQHHLSLKSVLLPRMFVSLYLCTSLQGNKMLLEI